MTDEEKSMKNNFEYYAATDGRAIISDVKAYKRCLVCSEINISGEASYCPSCGAKFFETEATIDLNFSLEEYYDLNEEARKQGLLLDDFISNILQKAIDLKS